MYQSRLPDILEDPIQEQKSSSSQCDIMDHIFFVDSEDGEHGNDRSFSFCVPSKEKESKERGSKYDSIDDNFLKEDYLDLGYNAIDLPFGTADNIGGGELNWGVEVPTVSTISKEREIEERLARKFKYSDLAAESNEKLYL
jgi:hypothetical protein